MSAPLQYPSNRVPIPIDKHPHRARPVPRKDQKLILRYDCDDGLDARAARVGRGLGDWEDFGDSAGGEVEDGVVGAAGEAEVGP